MIYVFPLLNVCTIICLPLKRNSSIQFRSIQDCNDFIHKMEKIDKLMFYLKYHLPWSSSKLGLARVHTRTFNTYSAALHVMLFIIPTITFSIGHDLALMSLCNHTILSHGTFSYWSGYFAGGFVIRPEHFHQYR